MSLRTNADVSRSLPGNGGNLPKCRPGGKDGTWQTGQPLWSEGATGFLIPTHCDLVEFPLGVMWFLRLARSSKKFSALYNMDVELVVTPRSIL